MLLAGLAALVLTSAAPPPACGLAHPQACRDIDELVASPGFDKALASFVGPGRWVDNNDFAASWIGTLLGGTPEDAQPLADGVMLFSACRRHACDEDMAAVIVRPGRILGIGVIAEGAPAVRLIFRDSRAARDLTPVLQDWARLGTGDPSPVLQTLPRPIRLPREGVCGLNHPALCKTTEMLNQADDYRAAIKAFVGDGRADWLALNPVVSLGHDFDFKGSLLDAVQAALGIVEAHPFAIQKQAPVVLPGGARLFEGHVFQQWGAGAVVIESGKVVGIGILNYACDRPCQPARVDLLFRDQALAARFEPALKDWAARAIFGSSDFADIAPNDRPRLVFSTILLPMKGPRD